MFRFLIGGRKNQTPEPEPQRQVFRRLMADLNTAIDELPEKPAVTIDPATGHISLRLPEQLPDEALALPAPEVTEIPETPEANEAQVA